MIHANANPRARDIVLRLHEQYRASIFSCCARDNARDYTGNVMFSDCREEEKAGEEKEQSGTIGRIVQKFAKDRASDRGGEGGGTRFSGGGAFLCALLKYRAAALFALNSPDC